MVGIVVHEDDGAGIREDEGVEGGPIGGIHGDLRRDIGVTGEARLYEGRRVILDSDKVSIADQKGDDVVRVCSQPGGNICKVRFGCTNVEKITGGVAVVDGIVYKMGLALEHTDAVVELIEDIEGLVSSDIVGGDERGVVSADEGDIAIPAGAELRVVIAGLGICRDGSREGAAQDSTRFSADKDSSG